MFKHTHTYTPKLWLIKMKDNDEIYGLKCYFSIFKNNDLFSESKRSYAMRNCAIVFKK